MFEEFETAVKRRRWLRDTAWLAATIAGVLVFIAAIPAALGLFVFVVRFAWELAGSLL